jgi:hypothetical protein
MAMWIQHAVAIGAVLGCAAWLGRCGWKTITGDKCSSGCGGCSSAKKSPAPAGPQTVFIPVEMLSRKK